MDHENQRPQPQHWYQSFAAPRPFSTLIKTLLGAVFALVFFSEMDQQKFFLGWIFGVMLSECGVRVMEKHPHRGAHIGVMLISLMVFLGWLKTLS